MPTVSPAVMLALAPYVAPIVVTLCVAFFKLLASRMPVQVRGEVEAIVHQCVLAVEQTSPGAPGAQKKQAAVALIGHLLGSLGLKVPAALIDVFIESSVAVLNEGKPAAAAVAQHVASVPMGFSTSVNA